MTIATQRRMTLEEYLVHDDQTEARHELVDGVLIEMGAENTINILISSFLFATLLQFVPYYRIHRGTEIVVPSHSVTSRFPDLMVLTEAGAALLPNHQRSMITPAMPVPMLVVEVVSPGTEDSDNYTRDYIEKRAEYAARGIPEYWIVDPACQIMLLLTLQAGEYVDQTFGGHGESSVTLAERIVSPTFPELNLTAAQILNAGRPS